MSNVSWLGRRHWTTTVYLPLAAVAGGTVLRLLAYLHRRSLWLDEAMVAQNVAHRSYRGLARPLALHQGAPVGWLWAQRTALLAFGENEYTWRLVPLLSGIGVLLCTWVVARRLLPRPFAVVPVALVAVNTALLDYSTEAKQYSTDAFVAVGLLALTLPLLERVTSRRLVAWTAAAVVAVWFSHPAVFFAAAYALAVVVAAALRRDLRGALAGCAAGAAAGASFLVGYVLVFARSGEDPVLREYWRTRGFPPPGRAAWWTGQALEKFLRGPAGLSPRNTGVALVLLGLAVLTVRRPAVGVALVTPLGLLLAASVVARKYPFDGRLVLALVPLTLIAACGALAAGWRVVQAAALAALLAVTAAPAAYAARQVVHPRDVQEVRAVLEHVRANLRPGDRVVVWDHGYPVEAYYANLLKVPVDLTVRYTPTAHLCEDRSDLAPATVDGGRVWLVLAQVNERYRKDLRRRFLAIGPETDTFERPQAWEYAFSPRADTPLPATQRQCLVLAPAQPLAH